MIESLLECVFEKVSKYNINATVHSPNSTKIQRSCQRCSQTVWFNGREGKGREDKRKGKEKKKEWGKESISSSVFGYEEKQKGKM